MAKHPRSAPPSARRQVAAGLAGAAVAALGALILGEYALSGATPYLAGVLFGLVVAEVILTVARAASAALEGAGALEAAAGLAWAVWISTGRLVAPVPASAYAAVVLGALTAGGWIWLPPRRSPAPPDRVNEGRVNEG